MAQVLENREDWSTGGSSTSLDQLRAEMAAIKASSSASSTSSNEAARKRQQRPITSVPERRGPPPPRKPLPPTLARDDSSSYASSSASHEELPRAEGESHHHHNKRTGKQANTVAYRRAVTSTVLSRNHSNNGNSTKKLPPLPPSPASASSAGRSPLTSAHFASPSSTSSSSSSSASSAASFSSSAIPSVRSSSSSSSASSTATKDINSEEDLLRLAQERIMQQQQRLDSLNSNNKNEEENLNSAAKKKSTKKKDEKKKKKGVKGIIKAKKEKRKKKSETDVETNSELHETSPEVVVVGGFVQKDVADIDSAFVRDTLKRNWQILRENMAATTEQSETATEEPQKDNEEKERESETAVRNKEAAEQRRRKLMEAKKHLTQAPMYVSPVPESAISSASSATASPSSSPASAAGEGETNNNINNETQEQGIRIKVDAQRKKRLPAGRQVGTRKVPNISEMFETSPITQENAVSQSPPTGYNTVDRIMQRLFEDTIPSSYAPPPKDRQHQQTGEEEAKDEEREVEYVNEECTQDENEDLSKIEKKGDGDERAIAVACFDFSGEEDDELSFADGERIIVLRHDPNEEWWTGTSLDGSRVGMFPANHVKLEQSTCSVSTERISRSSSPETVSSSQNDAPDPHSSSLANEIEEATSASTKEESTSSTVTASPSPLPSPSTSSATNEFPSSVARGREMVQSDAGRGFAAVGRGRGGPGSNEPPPVPGLSGPIPASPSSALSKVPSPSAAPAKQLQPSSIPQPDRGGAIRGGIRGGGRGGMRGRGFARSSSLGPSPPTNGASTTQRAVTEISQGRGVAALRAAFLNTSPATEQSKSPPAPLRRRPPPVAAPSNPTSPSLTSSTAQPQLQLQQPQRVPPTPPIRRGSGGLSSAPASVPSAPPSSTSPTPPASPSSSPSPSPSLSASPIPGSAPFPSAVSLAPLPTQQRLPQHRRSSSNSSIEHAPITRPTPIPPTSVSYSSVPFTRQNPPPYPSPAASAIPSSLGRLPPVSMQQTHTQPMQPPHQESVRDKLAGMQDKIALSLQMNVKGERPPALSPRVVASVAAPTTTTTGADSLSSSSSSINTSEDEAEDDRVEETEEEQQRRLEREADELLRQERLAQGLPVPETEAARLESTEGPKLEGDGKKKRKASKHARRESLSGGNTPTNEFLVKAVTKHKSKVKEWLGFKKGTIIVVTEVDEAQQCFYGYIQGKDKKQGWFPDYYVQRI